MKHIVFFVILLAITALAAQPEFYPKTTIAEALVVDGDPASDTALQDLDTIQGEMNRGEFFVSRLYSNSGDLSNASVDARLDHHDVSLYPSVVFNGAMTFLGPAPFVSYQNWVNLQNTRPAPVKMEVTQFDDATGDVSVCLTRIDPDMSGGGYYELVWFLMEDNVGGETNVARQILNQEITVPSMGNPGNFSNSFTLDPAWNTDNLWMAVSLVWDWDHILQSASSNALPEHYLRCAYDWYASDLVTPPNSTLESDPIWFFNLGAADNMSMSIVVDSTDIASDPVDWYFNYCDEGGNCYPGGTPLPLVMDSGETRVFDLNLMVGSSGKAWFHFEITSPNLGTFKVPFTCQTDDYVDNQDDALTPSILTLHGNKPNPFKGQTTFTISADRSHSDASIQIFNARGQKVAETRSTQLYQGENSIAWQVPENLPAGIYFYRLKDAPGTTRRMLLLK
ncbi:MAG: T9SS type A sorting domain-containing protein [Candidatus Syntrophosphaera sp.]